MNLEPQKHLTRSEKHDFYESAAKRFKAELRLTGAVAAIHIENKNDEIFWKKVLNEACPGKKFRYIASSRSASGFMTAGCTQCLQYRDFLDRHFWIAIDSDYRYLTEEDGIDTDHYILQTYTYSFENHFCYYKNCQRAIEVAAPEDIPKPKHPAQEEEAAQETEPVKLPEFSFEKFLKEYSRTVYPLMVWQLYLQEVGENAFPQKVFHHLIALPLGQRSIYNNGDSVLRVLKQRTSKLLKYLMKTYPDADTTWYEARCNAQGVHRDNCYLFVRGHQLYDMLIAQGQKFNKRFEKELTSKLYFGEYDEIRKIHKDILKLVNS